MLSRQTEVIIYAALHEAERRRHEYATAEHLAMMLFSDVEVLDLLVEANIDPESVKRKLNKFLESKFEKIDSDQIKTVASLGFKRIVENTLREVMSAGKNEVLPSHLLLAILAETDCYAAYYFKEAGLTREYLRSIFLMEENDLDEEVFSGLSDVSSEQEDSQSESSVLARFTINLNDAAKKQSHPSLVGREDELLRIIHVLLRYRKNNPLLIGEPGVGKTAIIEGLAERIVQKQVPESLQNAELFALDIATLLAGARYRGDFESRFKSLIVALEKRPGAILVIDEIHTVVGAGSTSGGSVDVANLLKPVLSAGKVRCIGSTTYKEFRTHFEKERALLRRFQKIDVNEPSSAECIEILRGIIGKYESFHNVTIKDKAIIAAVNLSTRYLHDRKLPDKAIDLIDEAAVMTVLDALPRKAVDNEIAEVTEAAIEKTVARMAQVPTKEVSKDDKAGLKNLEHDLKQVVFGQDAAIAELTNAIKLARAGLRDQQKPIGSFLFTGPTGVGKTEAAKQLAKTLGIEFLRFDMSEYMERHTVSRLIGAPPGYVGYDQGGLLTDAIHKTPHVVLLLDEVEKAHADLFNMLLQIMDYGKLTDANGRAADFRHVVLIMTSNIGAREMAQARIGFGDGDNSFAGEAAFKKLFSPEFRNRLDARIAFLPLAPDAMLLIVDKFLTELREQLGERKVTLKVSNDAVNYLARKGYDKAMGARPLARLIQDEIKRPLADHILFGDLINGGSVSVGLKNSDELTLSTKKTS
ncbi:MAG: AAA family ATPase [bacterium]|nr:AAA family ATPase [bacterium]